MDIKNVFSTKAKVDDLTSLKLESETIVDSFTKTARDLSEVNARIEAVVTAKKAEVQRLIDENSELIQTQTKNERLVNKINSFLE